MSAVLGDLIVDTHTPGIIQLYESDNYICLEESQIKALIEVFKRKLEFIDKERVNKQRSNA